MSMGFLGVEHTGPAERDSTVERVGWGGVGVGAAAVKVPQQLRALTQGMQAP